MIVLAGQTLVGQSAMPALLLKGPFANVFGKMSFKNSASIANRHNYDYDYESHGLHFIRFHQWPSAQPDKPYDVQLLPENELGPQFNSTNFCIITLVAKACVRA